MIVLFIKSDLIRQQPLAGYPCPHCHQTNSLTLDLHQRYADFAGGRVYPSGVFGVANCRHCGYTIPASRWNDDLHRAYVALKTGYKTPVSYWRGAIITAVGFVAGFTLLVGVLDFMGRLQRAAFAQRETSFNHVLARPKPGISLVVVGNNTGMEVWRISRVEDKTVWLKKYAGDRVLANPYTETGWATMPDSDFSGEAVGYSAQFFAEKGLKKSEDVANKTKPYDGTIFAVLDK